MGYRFAKNKMLEELFAYEFALKVVSETSKEEAEQIEWLFKEGQFKLKQPITH